MGEYLFLLLIPLTILAWYRPETAVLILLAALPTYMIRGDILGIPTTWLEVGIYVTFLVWLIKGGWREVLNINWLNWLSWWWPLVLWLAASWLGVLVAADVRLALGVWKGFIVDPLILSFMVAILALITKDKLKWWRQVLASLLIGASFITIIAGAQTWFMDLNRLQSGYESPNVLAMYLAPILAGAFVWYWYERKNFSRWLKIWWCLGLLLITAGIILTDSYTAWVAVGVTILVMMLVTWKRKLWPIMGLVILIISLFLPWLVVSSGSGLWLGHRNSIYDITSGEVRLTLWRQAIEFIHDQPLLGLGLGQWQPAFILTAEDKGWLSIKNPGLAIELHYASLYPHNLWLTTWLATGLLGLVALIWLVILVFVRPVSTLDFVPTAMILVQVIHGTLDTPLWKNDLSVLWWLPIIMTIVWSHQAKLNKEKMV